jgi:hypothetical protein
MNIGGVQINHEWNDEGNIVLYVKDKDINDKIILTPDIMAQSWEMQIERDYSELCRDEDWQKTLYELIISNPNENNVLLIAALIKQ